MLRNTQVDKEGVEHVGLQMVADSISSSRTVRPGGKAKAKPEARDDYRNLSQPAEDFDDADAIQF